LMFSAAQPDKWCKLTGYQLVASLELVVQW
jgi:hypothetical protein